MILRFQIEDTETGDEGVLQYDDDPAQKVITWGLFEGPDTLRDKLEKYLTTERTVSVAVSQQIDDFEAVTAKPVKDINVFQLSLNTLFINTGIRLGKVMNQPIEEAE